MDWTFEANDPVSGRSCTIDRRWPHWGPAIDPINEAAAQFDPPRDCDERLFPAPDDGYVLVWRADTLREYYECDYMTAQQALYWFMRQRIRPPDELTANLNIQIQKWPGDAQPKSMDQREFWELGRSVSDALGELVSAICEVFDDADEFDESYLDRAQSRLDRAALALLDALPQFGPTDDPFWAAWIKPPAYCDRLVDALSKVDDAAKYLVKEMWLSRARDAAFWKDAMKHLSVLHESLDNDVRWVEACPALDRALYCEARRNLEERQTTGLLAAVQTAPATEAQPAAVEAPAGEARAVEPAMASKAALMVAGRVPVAPPTDFELAAMWAPSQLAKRFQLNLGTLNKALERWSAKHGDGWHEVENRKPREPKYTYQLSAVLPLLNEMVATPSEAGPSSEMSA